MRNIHFFSLTVHCSSTDAKATPVSVSLARPQLANPTEIPADAKATTVFIYLCVCL